MNDAKRLARKYLTAARIAELKAEHGGKWPRYANREVIAVITVEGERRANGETVPPAELDARVRARLGR
jgi:hypothetical protein